MDAENGIFRFAGVTIFDDKPFLLSLAVSKDTSEATFRINCENTILAAMAKTNLVKALALLEGEKHS